MRAGTALIGSGIFRIHEYEIASRHPGWRSQDSQPRWKPNQKVVLTAKRKVFRGSRS
jgi:hypothetical protein